MLNCRSLVPSACLALCLALGTLPLHAQQTDAHAPIHYHYPRGRTTPQATGLPQFNVTFHGGPVQTTTTSYAIYWKPSGVFINRTYRQVIDQFLSDVGGSDIYGAATEYSGNNGQVQNVSTFGGEYVDTAPYPPVITTKNIEDTIQRAIAVNGWQPSITAQYFLMFGDGPQVGACAYHTFFNLNGQPVIYAVIPYFTEKDADGCGAPFGITPNANYSADTAIGNLSHEQTEMVTDPLLNAWYDPRNGEVGDICIYSYGVPFTSKFGNLLANGDQYIVQEEWSQVKQSCQPNL
ncbi:MAG TPA: hypothetical protein VFA68_22035 [Terriglobales bacterium]|nr:hypothetical protein [Terriglobales bacterium]